MASFIEKIITKNNNEVQLFSVEPCCYKKTLLVIGMVHGDEPEGEYIAKKMMTLEHKKNRVLYLTCLNPDGKYLNTRTNANGVDINRNFPSKNWVLSKKNRYFGGESPLSEIESRFLEKIIKKYSPFAILTLHTPFEVVNFDGDALDIAKNMAELSGYNLQENIGYPTPGSFGSYFGIEMGYKIITLEMTETNDFEGLWQRLKKSLEYFIEI